MNTPTLFLPSIMRHAWSLFQSHGKSLLILTVLPLIPLVLTLPFVAQLVGVTSEGTLENAPRLLNPFLALLALLGLIGAAVMSITSFAAMLIVLADARATHWHHALHLAWRRWLPFVWTQLLVSVLLAVGVVVLRALSRGPLTEGTGVALLALVMGLVLVVVGIVVAVWFSFAGLLAALGEASGVSALRESMALVRTRFWTVLWLLGAWMVVEVTLSRVVSPLPLLNWVVPVALTLFGACYLVSLYHALRRA